MTKKTRPIPMIWLILTRGIVFAWWLGLMFSTLLGVFFSHLQWSQSAKKGHIVNCQRCQGQDGPTDACEDLKYIQKVNVASNWKVTKNMLTCCPIQVTTWLVSSKNQNGTIGKENVFPWNQACVFKILYGTKWQKLLGKHK